jgi:predicted ester cyclase
LVQTGVPAESFEGINNGWRDYYWTKLGEYLRARKMAPVRRFLEEFKNHANIDIVDETWTKDSVLHLTGFPLPAGREGQKTIGRTIFAAFGDIHVEVNDTIVEGDLVVERHSATAVHKGEFNGIPATGKKVSWTENHIYRIADGKIAETWSEASFHDLMKQISSAPQSAKA